MSRRLARMLVLGAALLHAAPCLAQSAQGKAHFGGKPSGLVALISIVQPGETEEATVVTAEGATAAPFVLPARSVLVVTEVYAEGTGDPGDRLLGICTSGTCTDSVIRLGFDTNQELSRFQSFVGGVVFRAPPRITSFGGSAGAATVRIYGYLAKDQ